MRFMVIVKSNAESESGKLPEERLLIEMGKFNEELIKAGVMQAGEGLLPSAKGSRIKFSGSNRAVVDGPFTETKELVGGFWIWQTKTKDEAIEWAKKIPFDEGEVEIRQIAEAEDFEPVIKTQEGVETLAKEAAFRAQQQQTKH